MDGSGGIQLDSSTQFGNNGLLDIQTDAAVSYVNGFQPSMSNSGTVRKSAGAGTTPSAPPTPSVLQCQGTLSVRPAPLQVAVRRPRQAPSITVTSGTSLHQVRRQQRTNGGIPGGGTIDHAGGTLGNAAGGCSRIRPGGSGTAGRIIVNDVQSNAGAIEAELGRILPAAPEA